MKLSVVMLSLSVVTALCSACNQQQALSPPARVAPQSSECDKVARRITGLAPGLNPAEYTVCDDPNDNRCKRDPGETSIPSGVSYDPAADIIAACNIAPALFQKQLSKLHRIYINTDTDSTKPLVWGIRHRYIADPDDPNMKKKSIGMSLRIWNDSSLDLKPGFPYGSYETYILNALLNPWRFNPQSSQPALPSSAIDWLTGLFYTASPDPLQPIAQVSTLRALAVLGILAHEMGHVVWWENDIFNFSCRGTDLGLPAHFWAFSWTKVGDPPQFRFHQFGIEDHGANVPIGPDKDQVANDLLNQRFGDATRDLQQIYNGSWASLFATVAPDEDFIETFKLSIVTKALATQALGSLNIVIPGVSSSIDVIKLLNASSTLSNKMQWVTNCKWENNRPTH